MDPLTATINFLTTPVGQKVAQLLLDIDTKIITDIFAAFHATLTLTVVSQPIPAPGPKK